MVRVLRHSVLLLFVTAATVMWAEGFVSSRLRCAVSALGLTEAVTSAPSDTTALYTLSDGTAVVVRTSALGTLEHIGLRLFASDLRELSPSPVYDFLEYAALAYKYNIAGSRQSLSRVMFRKGSWASLSADSLFSLDCSVNCRDDKLYIVSWQREGHDVATVGIPVDYELLSGDSRRHLERDLVAALAAFHADATAAPAATERRDASLKAYGTEGLLVSRGRSYLMKELNQNLYYMFESLSQERDTLINRHRVRVEEEDTIPVMICSTDYPAESMANLVLGDDDTLPEADISLDVHLSDNSRQSVETTTNSLRRYFASQGCSLYYASRGTEDDTQRGILFVSNPALGYNHLINLKASVSSMDEERPQLQGVAYFYIPSIDEARLYGKTPDRKSGARIYN